ncbi:putative E3 ubiquitin-protein ligase LIN-1 [Magnolia sinica]|uniref:putative E3 ubiquitin-protein ligase LIN-1 n=1 Tax=Magnolia sinica TaxID=86752 RepID=UPI002657B2D8|nr:putative E3 ubiquitin-protein ligase LIN-1 [Magnolia sinica]
MAGYNKFTMDGKDIVRFLSATVGSFAQDRLINKDQRIQHKEQCAERLAAEDGSCDKNGEVRYSDQAVLANLDWGIDALEEAINTSNIETKNARLDYAEKMLQVCAMLNSHQKTAGVPNFYLSAWAHLNLAFLWKLRNNVHNSVLHVLEMFIVDPFFSRIDFAPELWEVLFLPHMSSIVGWYSESRHKIVMEVIPDSADLSFTADFDQFFNESLILSMRPDQADKLQKLEKLYGESLDENTRLYARYYKECVTFNSTVSKKGMPMFPIAEPPMTPLHEVSRSIPNYVKFGPILPKSAGFSPILKDKDDEQEHCRLNITSNARQKLQDIMLPENEDGFDADYGDADMDSNVRTPKVVATKSMSSVKEEGSGSKIRQSRRKDSRSYSPNIFSPMDSPCTPPKVASPQLEVSSKKEPEQLLRLLSGRLTNPTMPISLPNSLPESPRPCNDSSISSAESDGEVLEVQKNCRKSFSCNRSMSFGNTKTQVSEDGFLSETEEEVSQSSISPPSSEKTPRTRPSKDFVCPITGQLFSDPVTLETGQTYERRAIQEWLRMGKTTCPITRQPLSATILPKTNYVLKRLITSWKEQYPDLAQEFSYSETPRASLSSTSSSELPLKSTPSVAFNVLIPRTTNDGIKGEKINRRFMQSVVATSPTSVISQAATESVINSLKPYTSCLCTSEDLQECEAAVLKVARIWKDSKADPAIHAYLVKPTIVNGFVEILMASVDREVLRTSIYILSELIFTDESIGEILTSVDSDFDCLAALLKNGLAEATVLIYQLRPAFSQLSNHDLIPSLVQVIINKNDESNEFRLVVEPKDAAIVMLDQILLGGDENSKSNNASNVISVNGLPALIKCLHRIEGRVSVVSILLSCMRADKSCRNFIANRAELSPVLELFHAGDDSSRSVCIDFISELVRLNRRTFCNQILQIIRDEGAFSTMHTFLAYLQMAPMDQQPAVASLLIQLDLLVEPRKMSIYREEAIETLIEALHRKDFPVSQIIALDALASLSGRLTASGKSLTETWLLKTAGLNQPYNALMKAEKTRKVEDESIEKMEEEEKAASAWEKRVAFVLCNHENGSIFKALEECFKSNSLEMAKQCLVVATWLTHMLNDLPNTGVRDIARQCLLDQFINILQSSKNLEEKVLATLALRSFIHDPDALKELGTYANSICKPLRKLKRCSVVVADTLKALMNLPSVNATELWSCAEAVEIDASANGDVLSLVHLKGRIFSSHSDGHIKVWDSGKKILRLIQEVREHIKAVTCMFIPPSGDKLYSGSLDKTIRVWAIGPEEIHCVQVYDMKESVHSLAASSSLACFASQATGAKVYNWGGITKHVNFSKNVKCLAMMEESIYCGCTGYSIQEVDLRKGTSSIFYSGTRKLLGKQTIHALCIRDGHLFAGGSSVDGLAGKVFSLSTRAVIGSLSTGFDIHSIAANNDFVFTGTKCGIIEVWLRERLTRVASLKVHGGGNTKITSLASDSDGEMLFAGTSDGKIQGWSLD